MIRAVLCWFCSGALLLWPVTTDAAEAQQSQTSDARFIGAVGCKSSSCHGGAGEKRSQYTTWLKQDFHARGYAILTNARSARMAETLGLSAAQTSSRCTACHSPFQAVPAARLSASANPAEAVSCESCHGAAESWLRGHTRPDWTYATRLGAGMRDLRNFYVRANTCVACHQNLEADLANAGHPRLIFELDGQSVAQPKHWRDPEGSGVRAWLVGQAVALRETSWRLAQNSAAEPHTLAQWNALAWLLNKVTAFDRTLLPVEPPNAENDSSAFARSQQQADALARRAAQQNFGNDFARRLLRELAASDSDFREPRQTPRDVLQLRAHRLLLALERLAAGDEEVSGKLATLRNDLSSPADFDPAQFAAHLARLRADLQ